MDSLQAISDISLADVRGNSLTLLSPAGPPSRHHVSLQSNYEHTLVRELQPIGLVEQLLTREVARRAAQVDGLDAARELLDRQAKDAWGNLLSVPLKAGDQVGLGLLAAPDRSAVLAAESITASRAMIRAIEALDGLRTGRLDDGHDVWTPDPRFRTEPACCIYLLRRYRHGETVCRCCERPTELTWLPTHRCVQCRICHTQTCIRHGTVMAHSHVPLTKWFHAIRLLLISPSITTTDLRGSVDINRTATIGLMRSKILSAFASKDATRLLAGLDAVYMPPG